MVFREKHHLLYTWADSGINPIIFEVSKESGLSEVDTSAFPGLSPKISCSWTFITFVMESIVVLESQNQKTVKEYRTGPTVDS